jgi:hypothetical protein
VRCTLKNWTALTRYGKAGDLESDNNATERANRGVAVGRHSWVFFGSDEGSKTAAVLRGFLPARRSGRLCLAQGRSLPHRRSSHQPNRRTSAAQPDSRFRLAEHGTGQRAAVPHQVYTSLTTMVVISPRHSFATKHLLACTLVRPRRKFAAAEETAKEPW